MWKRACWLAIKEAKRDVLDERVPFGAVGPFLEALSLTNGGTTPQVIAQDGVFQRAFLALRMCVDSFWHSTRVVCLDACHIKAYYGGVVLVMTSLDGNNQVFPGAVAITESENVDTWTLFLDLVRSAFRIGDGEGIVFLSDREKGIEAAVTQLFPHAQHAFCVYHIQKNVKVNFHTTFDGLLFQAAKADCARTFEVVMAQMMRLDSSAGEYVSKMETRDGPEPFPGRRFGHVTFNISESMNWWLEKARYLEPVGFFSVYIRKINALFQKRRGTYFSMHPDSLQKKNVAKILANAVEKALSLRLVRRTPSIFEVERKDANLPFRVVNLNGRSCSCGFPQEYGIPCRHMCRALLSLRIHPKSFVVPERSLEALNAINS